ncbi:MAG: efflux RND transporter permease subunit [Planctomycetaceae bacterium]|nr:efflux RND transporter permease subunit [Planctomycetaceae bacterium]
MGLIRFAIQNPVKVTVAVILTVMFGMISLLGTPVQLTPDVLEPEITVTTVWPGASAQEIEREIIDEQEEQLKSVEGLREFTSQGSDSRGSIVLKFEVGTDLTDARAKVSDKLNQVPEYPQDANEPVITTVNANANAIAWFILKPLAPTVRELHAFIVQNPELADGEGNKASTARVVKTLIRGRAEHQQVDLTKLNKLAQTYPALGTFVVGKNDPAKMRKFAEDIIEARFERVDGIANSNVYGGREQEFRIVVNPARLASYQLTIGDLRTAVRQRNKNTSGGDIREGKLRNVVRTIGQYESPDEVGETIIAIRDGRPIRVADVAAVGLAYKKPDGVVRQKGLNGLAVNAQQAPSSNLIEVMGPPAKDFDLNGDGELTQLELSEAKLRMGDSLRIAAAEMNLGILKQRGLMLEQVYDQTEYLNSATDLVQQNIFVGGGLAILVLLLFLRSPRSVLIIGVTIPISVIATFIFIRGFGRSINVISLAGMAFAVGMVVDNAIVVLENIYRHYEAGDNPEQAAAKGATEVWGAVLASTLTTLAVFIPVIFVEGQAGQLFRDIAIAISCAVGVSLIISITVIPTAAKRILRRRAGHAGHSKKQKRSFLTDGFARLIDKLLGMPGSVFLRVIIVVVFVAGSILGALALLPEREYLPEGNRNLVIAILLPPPGYNVDQMIALGERIEAEIAPHWEAEPGSPEEAALNGPRIDNFFFVARGRMLFMGARSVDPLRCAELVPILARASSGAPGVIPIVSQASLFDSALSGGRNIDIEITGPDLETLVAEGQKVFGMCMQEFPMSQGNQLRPIPSLDLSSPEVHVLPRWEKAAEQGISATALGYSVDALIDGAFSGDYWHDGTKIDLVIYGADEYARHTQDLGSLPISTPAGNLVNVSAIADVRLSNGPEQINHIERLRAITIQVKPAPGIPLEQAMNIINEKIRRPLMETPAFEGGLYQIRLAGTADKLGQTGRELQWNLILALLITYLLMAALFESFFYPLVIMTSVILALVGGFGGLAVLNMFTPQTLDMLTMLGFVILIGTVVNNAILIVHQALNHMRNDGMDERQAVVESVRTRIRPIFMSTLTTVLGMLPLVLPVPTFADGTLIWVSGAGSELYRGLGSVVLGGLVVSTVFTLVLVPVGFSLALDVKKLFAGLFGFTRNKETLATAAVAASTPFALSQPTVNGDADVYAFDEEPSGDGADHEPKVPVVEQPDQGS